MPIMNHVVHIPVQNQASLGANLHESIDSEGRPMTNSEVGGPAIQ